MAMLDYICMGSPELYGMGSKHKIQNENICLHQQLNQRPLAFQAGTLDHWAMLTVIEMESKVLYYLGIWLKSIHVAIPVSNW